MDEHTTRLKPDTLVWLLSRPRVVVFVGLSARRQIVARGELPLLPLRAEHGNVPGITVTQRDGPIS